MTQAEVLEMAGFGGLEENDLVDDLDRAEDEDEEEEFRASQMQIEREGGVDEDLGQENVAPPQQEISSFEPDPAVFQELIQEDEEELMGTQSQRRSGQDGVGLSPFVPNVPADVPQFEALFED